MSFMSELLTLNIPIWEECAATPFVRGLQTATLPQEKFREYIIQDSIYLKNYARVYGKLIYHSTTLSDLQFYYSALGFVTDTESAVRLCYLKQFGLNDRDIETMEPLPENVQYIQFLLDMAERGNPCELLMAVLPCMLSYSYIFRKIAAMPETVPSRYYDLIQDYAEDTYYESCRDMCEFADRKCAPLSAEKKDRLSHIFEGASLLELAFWRMAGAGP